MQREMRGINVRNLIWKIIFAWKNIVVGAVIMALLLTGFKYMSDINNANYNVSTELEISEEQKANVNELIELYEQLNYYENYLEDSLLMQVNPLCYQSITLQYYIDSFYVYDFENGLTNNYTPALVRAYASHITSDIFIDELKEILNIEASSNYIREIFTVIYDVESYVVQINVIVPDDINSEKILAAMKQLLAQKEDSLQNIGKHELEEVNSSIDEAVSQSLVERKNNIIKTIESLKQSIETVKISLTDQELVYLDEHLIYEQYKGGYVKQKEIDVSIDIKYLFIGLVVGAICVIAAYCIVALFSNKLQDINDLRALYNIKIIGSVKTTKEKSGLVMSLLRKIRDRNIDQITYEQQLGKITTGIEILCKKSDIEKLYISSSCLKKIDKKLLDDFSQLLKSKNVEICGIGTLFSDSETLEQANNAGGIILLEILDKSNYEQIEQEVIVAKDYSINILGAIITQ